MLLLSLRNLTRRPLRSALTLVGLAIAVATLACLSAFGNGYERSLGSEINGMGMQLMLVPMGCPYDAAARVLRGKGLEYSLGQDAVEQARRDPAVEVAAPLLMAAVPRVQENRTDVWVGLDQAARQLKPWWNTSAGKEWFDKPNSVILGAEAAELEMRATGDKLFSPETRHTFQVSGVLKRSGTSDDSLFFVPLATAQSMFKQPQRITAVAIRLRDPSLLPEAAERLQKIPGAQVVTLTEMMGTFLNLIGAARALLTSIAVVALAAGALGVFNTLLAAIVERTGEIAIMRALGASKMQIFGLFTIESLLLTTAGSLLGLLMVSVAGRGFENIARHLVPMAPTGAILLLTPVLMAQCMALGAGIGVLAGAYPAWQATRLSPANALKPE
ncbi:MAG TPA: ABC transporter permease [Abditibacteriaceae bacterium]|jgi:putative ABC transport system permease protein